MAQKTIPRRAPQTSPWKPKKPTPITGNVVSPLVDIPPVDMGADADAQDDREWDAAFAASQDTLARLAERSRAHQAAGRTKRINP